ncbi:MAG: hypothetical protein UY26_C0003G0324 [Candidatus Jorgensenbacteria bacterium GW2011_GWA1_48_13]|uniref:Dockerin domain-containing protein n=1 Tax=Candidatus Jorgensenbacteria bacterium GW2011_GWB1_50_10 TaxID=1618665 RepID=A0A0G1W7V5_9BACT|nr:MAG: hypothetical protein UY26_C0003G0324 [Candidatus Jorgensenbacteria bacterium GW2011_GWA1_48_13]KKW14788.1 MAG: hypothetical protein UY55_C0003G0004 [Candidatus Jorgensenbacteria bacterium GW2011_GWB1_50_10]
MKLVLICLIGLIGLIGLSAHATDFSSNNFTVKDPVIKPGAGFATSTSFQLWSSLGQEAIGLSDATSFVLKSGFLYFPAPAAGVATPTGPIERIGGGLPIFYLPPIVAEGCDFSGDGRCDIIDFSILLYYLDQTGPTIAPYDLNNDGKLDIVDISILLFYWV